MAPNYFQKPETALKRAQELIQIDKVSDALDTLHDTIKARRQKQWTSVHEQIMMKHMELCVDLKKHHLAKDALFQYKGLTQQVNVKSLETVVDYFLKLAEQKTEEAQKQSIDKVEEIGDLDQGDVPERLLLAVVSGAAAQDRMDRTVLAPWLRFLWESYRNCLELLRNNAQVEHLYHQIVRQSFNFCLKYQRRTEFRKLCDLLRLHLNQIQKHQYAAHVVKLTSPESLTLMQETRLYQFDTAIKMELWQEAYKSAEDVHGMMQLSKDKDKRTVKPASYVNYYDKLALVFWKAGNSLFHAAALLQKYIIYKDMKKSFTQEEAQEQASRVLLATLSIPEGSDAPSDLSRNLDIEEQHVANMRLLSNLLRLPIAPTKAGILKEAARIGVPEAASKTSNDLYKLLENNFSPLRVANDVEALFASIEKDDHGQYVAALRSVAAIKCLKQISVIYDSISWERIKKVIPYYSDLELERIVVEASKHRIIRAQIDHRADCVRFGSAEVTLAGGFDLEDTEGFTGDNTQLGIEGIRNHLELMYLKLRKMVHQLDGEKYRSELLARVENHAINYERHRPTEIDRIQQRKKKLENYKENWERVKAEKTLQAQTEAAKREEIMRADEMKRLEEQNKESERKRKQAEQEEIQRKIKQDQLRKMQQNAIYQAIIKEKGLDQFQDMDPEQVLREQRERLDREREETQKRLQQQDKNFDHQIRALHLEEMQERRAIMSMRMAKAPEIHEKNEEERIKREISKHEEDVKLWNMWEQVRDQAFDWVEQVKENNAEDFKHKISVWENKLKEVRNFRLEERAQERMKERRERRQKEKLEEERRKREDEIRNRMSRVEEQKKQDGRDRRFRDEDSAAMRDSNWRSAGSSTATSRPAREETMRPREERAPFKERAENTSKADQDNVWRRGTKPTAAVPSRPSEERKPMAPRQTAPDAEATWSRGQTVSAVKKEAPKEEPKPTGKFIPSRLRREGAGAASSGPSRDTAPPARGNRPPPRPATKTSADADSNWRR